MMWKSFFGCWMNSSEEHEPKPTRLRVSKHPLVRTTYTLDRNRPLTLSEIEFLLLAHMNQFVVSEELYLNMTPELQSQFKVTK